MGPGVESRRQHHIWCEFVVGSRPCYKRFSLGVLAFSSSREPIFSKSNLVRNDSRRTTNLNVLPSNWLFIYLFIFINPSTLPFFRPSILPLSRVMLKNLNFLCRVKQLMMFVWNKMNLPSGLCCVRTVGTTSSGIDEWSTSRYRCSTFSSHAFHMCLKDERNVIKMRHLLR